MEAACTCVMDVINGNGTDIKSGGDIAAGKHAVAEMAREVSGQKILHFDLEISFKLVNTYARNPYTVGSRRQMAPCGHGGIGSVSEHTRHRGCLQGYCIDWNIYNSDGKDAEYNALSTFFYPAFYTAASNMDRRYAA